MMEALPEIPEVMPDDFVDLSEDISKAWESLAHSISNPDLLFQLLEDICNNALCIAVTGALWVVLGFKVFAHIISIVRARN